MTIVRKAMAAVAQAALVLGLGSMSHAGITAPTDIGNCVLWLDAGQGVTHSAVSVSAWADQSPAGNNMTQGMANRQPTLVTSAVHGLPAVSFATGPASPADNDYLANSALQLDTTTTAFFVINPDSLPAGSGQRFAGHYSNGQFRFNSGKASMWTSDGNADLNSPTPTAGQFQIITYKLDSNVQMGIDSPALTTTRTSASINSSDFLVGGVPNTFVPAGQYGSFDGDIAEVVVYDRPLALGEINAVGRYLADKYALTTSFVPEPPAGATSTLIQVDLQMSGAANQETQAGWDGQSIPKGPSGNPNSFALTLTADGTAAGITATLGGDTNGWEARGGSAESRGEVTGTSFDDVVEDFVATRDGAATIDLTGLTVGSYYALEAWHNDSYTINQGFGSGGGVVTPSVIGAALYDLTAGRVTNLKGAQTDAAFGVTSVEFLAMSTSATVTLTSTNPNGYLPINGIVLDVLVPETAGDIPEPATMAMLGLAFAGLGGYVRRRRKG